MTPLAVRFSSGSTEMTPDSGRKTQETHARVVDRFDYPDYTTGRRNRLSH